jgi:hypothetical protein
MNRRVNIVLAEGTLRKIDRIAKPGERSRFINRANEHFVAHQSAEAADENMPPFVTAISIARWLRTGPR